MKTDGGQQDGKVMGSLITRVLPALLTDHSRAIPENAAATTGNLHSDNPLPFLT